MAASRAKGSVTGSQLDFAEGEASLSTGYYSGGRGSWSRVQYVLYRLLNLMTENKKTSSWSKIVELALLVTDWLQVVAILLTPTYGWRAESFRWAQEFSLLSLALPEQTPSVFNMGFGIAISLAWISIANAVYVAWALHTNRYKRIWPLKTLRVLVSALVSAGFIPIVTMLSYPFECSAMQAYFGILGQRCFAWPLVMYFVAALLTLLLFVPFALLMRAVYFDDNPLSGMPTAKPIGRLDFYDTVFRAALVLAGVFFTERTILLALITGAMVAFLYLFVNFTLPYYKMKINQLRSGMYLLLFWLSLGSFITANIDFSSDDSYASWCVGWVSASIALFAIGLFTPLIRYRWLGRIAYLIGDQSMYDAEMDRMGISRTGSVSGHAPSDLYELRRKSTRAKRKNSISAASLRNLFAQGAEKTTSRRQGATDHNNSEFSSLLKHNASGRSKKRSNMVSPASAGTKVSFSVKQSRATNDPVKKVDTKHIESSFRSPTSEPRDVKGNRRLDRDATAAGAANSPAAAAGKSSKRDLARVSNSSSVNTGTARGANDDPNEILDSAICGSDVQRLDTVESWIDDRSSDSSTKTSKHVYKPDLAVDTSTPNGGRNDDSDTDDMYLEQPGKYPLAELVKKYYLFEYDVELMVRNLLTEPTRENFEQAVVILNAALVCYPESVFIRLAYCTIVLTYASDSYRAVSLLQSAQKLASSFDLRFLIFSKIHAWNQIRQTQNLGTGRDMVSVIQFKKSFTDASASHRDSIRAIARFWSLLFRSGDDMQPDTVADIVRRFAEARDTAEKAYLSLLDRYPNNRQCMRSYGLFCLYVKNEESIGDMYLKRSSAVASANAADSALNDGSTNDGGSSSLDQSSMGNSTLAEMRARAKKRKLKVKHEEYHSLKIMRLWFRVAIFLLFGLTVGMFVGSSQLLARYSQNLTTMDAAGRRRSMTEDVWYYARDMNLYAYNGDKNKYDNSALKLLQSAKEMEQTHSDLYYSGIRSTEIDKLWGSRAIDANFWISKPPYGSRTEQFSLWDLGNFYLTEASILAQLPMSELANPRTIVPWRFIADNSFEVMLNAYEDATSLYESNNQKTTLSAVILQGSLLGIKVIVTLAMGIWVFVPAIFAVRRAKQGVHNVVERIPRFVVRFFYRRFRAVSRIYANIETADEDTANILQKKLEEPKLRDLSKLTNRSTVNVSSGKHMSHTEYAPQSIVKPSTYEAYRDVPRASWASEDAVFPTSKDRTDTGYVSHKNTNERRESIPSFNAPDQLRTPTLAETETSLSDIGASPVAKPSALFPHRYDHENNKQTQNIENNDNHTRTRFHLDRNESSNANSSDDQPNPDLPYRQTSSELQVNLGEATEMAQTLNPTPGVTMSLAQTSPASFMKREVDTTEVGEDAFADARLAQVMQEVDQEVEAELADSDDEEGLNSTERNSKSTPSRPKHPDAGKEVIGSDGVLRRVDSSGELCAKLSEENLNRLQRMLTERESQAGDGDHHPDVSSSFAPALSSAASVKCTQLSSAQGPRQTKLSIKRPIRPGGPVMFSEASMSPNPFYSDAENESPQVRDHDIQNNVPSQLLLHESSSNAPDSVENGVTNHPAQAYVQNPINSLNLTGAPLRGSLPGTVSPNERRSKTHIPQLASSQLSDLSTDRAFHEEQQQQTTSNQADTNVERARFASIPSDTHSVEDLTEQPLMSTSLPGQPVQPMNMPRGTTKVRNTAFMSRLGPTGSLAPISENRQYKARLPEEEQKKRPSFTNSSHSVNQESQHGWRLLCQRCCCGNTVCQPNTSNSKSSSNDKQIQSLAMRVFASMLFLTALYVGNFFTTIQIMQQGGYKSTELNNAARRTYLSTEVVNLVRELLINDNQIMNATALTDRLADRLVYLNNVHHALRQGDESMNLPGSDRRNPRQEELMYGRLKEAFELSGEPYNVTFVSHGVGVALQFLMQGATSLLEIYGNQTYPRPGLNLTALEQTQQYGILEALERDYLRPGLVNVSELYLEEGRVTVSQLRGYEIIIFVFNLLILVLLWATVYRTMAKQLLAEGGRSEDVLSLIPQSVVEKCKTLHVFFTINASSWLHDDTT